MNANHPSDLPFVEDPIPVEEAFRILQSSIAQVDNERVAAYQHAAKFQTAKTTSLARQERLLARKLGRDHPRVLAARRERGLKESALRDLRVAQVQTATVPPKADPAGYVLHGYVRTTEREQVQGAVVAVYDCSGNLQSGIGHAVTDTNGYFKLPLTELASAAERPRRSDEEKGGPLEVRVFQADRKPLRHRPVILQPRPGETGFREILVEPEPPPPPPPQKVPPKQQPTTPGHEVRKPSATLKAFSDELRQAAARRNVPSGQRPGQAKKETASPKRPKSKPKRSPKPSQKGKSKKGR